MGNLESSNYRCCILLSFQNRKVRSGFMLSIPKKSPPNLTILLIKKWVLSNTKGSHCGSIIWVSLWFLPQYPHGGICWYLNAVDTLFPLNNFFVSFIQEIYLYALHQGDIYCPSQIFLSLPHSLVWARSVNYDSDSAGIVWKMGVVLRFGIQLFVVGLADNHICLMAQTGLGWGYLGPENIWMIYQGNKN